MSDDRYGLEGRGDGDGRPDRTDVPQATEDAHPAGAGRPGGSRPPPRVGPAAPGSAKIVNGEVRLRGARIGLCLFSDAVIGGTVYGEGLRVMTAAIVAGLNAAVRSWLKSVLRADGVTA